jgi:uncharacterized protein
MAGNNISFAWDPKKAHSNQKKHAISFTEAQTVFLDEKALLIADPDHSQEEDRFILLGCSSKSRVLIVCYSAEGDAMRIISARKATRSERKQYQERQSK